MWTMAFPSKVSYEHDNPSAPAYRNLTKRTPGLKVIFLLIIISGMGVLYRFTSTIILSNFIPSGKEQNPTSTNTPTILPAPDITSAAPTLQSRLLNISNFSYRRNNKFLCRNFQDNKTQQLLPVLVHSARAHFVERQAIRNTWGSLTNYRNFTVRPIFLLGEARPEDILLNYEVNLEQKLDEEHSLHNDLVTGNFVDSYRNLTYKLIMGYKWILENCQEIEFVLKADDDIVLDITRFIDARLADIERGHPMDFYCCHKIHTKPIRHQSPKLFVTLTEFPDEYYPNYCSGWASGITVEWIRKLYTMSHVARYLFLEDVFSGILTEMAKVAFREKPHISNICRWFAFRKACRDIITLGDTSGKFKAVVPLPRNDLFAEEMDCVWNYNYRRVSHNQHY